MGVPPPSLAPDVIRGRTLRAYPVRTLAEVDESLRSLVVWLRDQMASAPEFGYDHGLRYCRDRDRLLDQRLRIMADG